MDGVSYRFTEKASQVLPLVPTARGRPQHVDTRVESEHEKQRNMSRVTQRVPRRAPSPSSPTGPLSNPAGPSGWETSQGGADHPQSRPPPPPASLPHSSSWAGRGQEEQLAGGGRKEEGRIPTLVTSSDQALTQETPPQHRTPRVSHAEPHRPPVLPLPEHLQLNRKQRSDSPVADSS